MNSTHHRLVEILTNRFAGQDNGRHGILSGAFPALLYPQQNIRNLVNNIDYFGNLNVFVGNLIPRLQQFGDVRPGLPAIVVLLREARAHVGGMPQAEIDALIAELGGMVEDPIQVGAPTETTHKRDETNRPAPTPDKINILFLASMPATAPPLRLGEEQREITAELERGGQRDRFHMEARAAVQLRDLSRVLLNSPVQIVHFSGHGAPTGELVFEMPEGGAHPVPPAALERLFAQFTNTIQCVVLNACFSETQAVAIAKHIPYVIGMSKEIGDRAAIEFAAGFYQALAAGRNPEQAFEFGLVQYSGNSGSSDVVPQLIRKGESTPNP